MQFTTIVALAFAALAAATPSAPLKNHGSSSIKGREPNVVTFIMTEPDCDSLKDYCTHCNGDFNCETDPRCEWCYENDKFGN